MRTDEPAKWFRLYAEFATDPKVQMLSEVEQRRYLMLLCLRCSNGNVTLHETEVAFQLRISDAQWSETKGVLMSKDLVDKDGKPTAWEKRQFDSDTSAARVSEHRKKKKLLCNVTETAGNGKSNAPEKRREEKEVNPLSDKSDRVQLSNGKAKFKGDAEIVLAFLNEKTGKAYRPVKANLELIAERMKEGATLSDCRRVVESKANEWGGDGKMDEFLRPATLFGKKNFWQYEGASKSGSSSSSIFAGVE